MVTEGFNSLILCQDASAVGGNNNERSAMHMTTTALSHTADSTVAIEMQNSKSLAAQDQLSSRPRP